MFEYNFGDSEFLMLFLVLITLPFAADRRPLPDDPRISPAAARRAPREILADAFAAAVTSLVVGDVMLDHFMVGRVTRISPEAPVPVVEFDREEFRARRRRQRRPQRRALGGRVDARRRRRDDARGGAADEALRAQRHRGVGGLVAGPGAADDEKSAS